MLAYKVTVFGLIRAPCTYLLQIAIFSFENSVDLDQLASNKYHLW